MAKKKNKKHKQAARDRLFPKSAAPGGGIAGAQPAPGPGQVYVPPTPGVPTPTPDPFFTPDDLLAINDYQTNEASQLTGIDSALDDARIQRDYDLTQAEDQFKQNLASATDDMIGRGLFQSSVKDAAVYDLEAMRGLQRAFLNDRYSSVLSDANARKDQILGSGGSRERFWAAMNLKKVGNAQDIGATLPPWQVEPTEGHFAPAPPPAPGQPGYVPAHNPELMPPVNTGTNPATVGRSRGKPPHVPANPLNKKFRGRRANVRRVPVTPARDRLLGRG